MHDQRQLGLHTLDKLEAADDALRAHLVRGQFGAWGAGGKLHAVGSIHELLAREDGGVAIDDGWEMLARGLEHLLRH